MYILLDSKMKFIKIFLVFIIFVLFVVSSTCFAEDEENLSSTVSDNVEIGYRVQNNDSTQETSSVSTPAQSSDEVNNSDDSIIVIEGKNYLIHDGKALLLE